MDRRVFFLVGAGVLLVGVSLLLFGGLASGEGASRPLPAQGRPEADSRPHPWTQRRNLWGSSDGPGAATATATDDAPADPAPVAESTLVPEEWEPPLFDILLNKEQGMDKRNARLIELATVSASHVPTVQQECLRHLVFGLSDEDGALFLSLATNPVIPVSLRFEFLKEALGIRPLELGSWLSRQLNNHHEPEISSLARRYLLDIPADSDAAR